MAKGKGNGILLHLLLIYCFGCQTSGSIPNKLVNGSNITCHVFLTGVDYEKAFDLIQNSSMNDS